MADISKDEFVELFEIQLRGAVATAFVHSSIKPLPEYWDMLRGKKEFTMRDLGEIGYLTGFNLNLQISRQFEQREAEGEKHDIR